MVVQQNPRFFLKNLRIGWVLGAGCLSFSNGEIFPFKKWLAWLNCGWSYLVSLLVGWFNFRNFHHHHSEIWVTHVHPFLKILVGGDDESLLNFPWIFSETFAFGVDEK